LCPQAKAQANTTSVSFREERKLRIVTLT